MVQKGCHSPLPTESMGWKVMLWTSVESFAMEHINFKLASLTIGDVEFITDPTY